MRAGKSFPEFSHDPERNPDSGTPEDPPHDRWRGVVASRPTKEYQDERDLRSDRPRRKPVGR
jgi:hypothetical protein